MSAKTAQEMLFVGMLIVGIDELWLSCWSAAFSGAEDGRRQVGGGLADCRGLQSRQPANTSPRLGERARNNPTTIRLWALRAGGEATEGGASGP